MPNNNGGGFVIGLNKSLSQEKIEQDLKDILKDLNTLEVQINHAKLTDNAKKELRDAIKDIKDLTANINKTNSLHFFTLVITAVGICFVIYCGKISK